MSTSPKNRVEEREEIDLSMVSKGIGNFFGRISYTIFKIIQFTIKNIVIIGILFVLGVGLGLYLDKTQKTYNHQIIVQPNFGSTDYLYAKIDLLESKIKDNDTVYLKKLGFKDVDELDKIEVEPVIDVYRFINNSEQNFELLKLLSEDSDIKKIVEEKATSKNYPYHLITFKTKELTTRSKTFEPLMAFLNDSDFFHKLQKEYINNLSIEMKANEVTIGQIDGFLNSFSNTVNGNSKSDKLVYYNENTQLNDVIQTKNKLIDQQGKIRIDLIGSDRIVKDNSSTINIENKESINGKLKLVLPFLFIFLYVGSYIFINFYRKQKNKA